MNGCYEQTSVKSDDYQDNEHEYDDSEFIAIAQKFIDKYPIECSDLEYLYDLVYRYEIDVIYFTLSPQQEMNRDSLESVFTDIGLAYGHMLKSPSGCDSIYVYIHLESANSKLKLIEL